MITPDGLPAFTRTATPSLYGAVPGLHDLGGVGAVNAKTDITAAEYARLAADTASAVRSAPLLWMTLQIATSPSNSVTVLQCQPMWDIASGSYPGGTPPSGSYPTVTFDGSLIALTFGSLETLVDGVLYLRAADEYGVQGDFHITSAVASVANSGGSQPSIEIVSGVSVAIEDLTLDGTTLYLVLQ